jgi:hypothetical protein
MQALVEIKFKPGQNGFTGLENFAKARGHSQGGYDQGACRRVGHGSERLG